MTLKGWNWRETVELMNNKRHVTGKLGHFLGAPHENLHSWRRRGFFSLRCRHSKPFVYKWFGRCVGRLQRRLGVLEEEEIGVCRKLHPESPYCYDIKTSSSSNFFKCEKSAYLKKGKKRVSSLNFYHYNFALQKVSVDQFTPCLLDLCKVC